MKALNSIMLVDDDITTNFLHEILIQEMNIASELIVAVDGKEAIDKLQELLALDNCWPDLILVDIKMPRMDGFQFLQISNEMYLETEHPPIVVVVSSSLNREDVEKVKELNAKGYIPKPLNVEKLKDVLKEYF